MNGELVAEDQEDKVRHIAEYTIGKFIEGIDHHCLNHLAFGEYGLKEPLPRAFGDIPAEWLA